MQTSNHPSPPIATELLELSQHLAASQLSVKKLRKLIDQDSASLNIDELIGQLIDDNYHDGAQTLATAAGLSRLNVDARCLSGILPLADDVRGLPLLIHLTLFSLDPASDELIVQELIHRRDLEKAVKHYAG